MRVPKVPGSRCEVTTFWLKGALSVQCGPGMPDFGQASDRPVPQFIRYAPINVIDGLAAITPKYRESMDAIMAERAQHVAPD